MANVIYTVPLAESALISALSFNLLANSNANVSIGGGSNGQAIITDGLGNLSWGNVGTGTVTNIATSGSGLGFSLTGGPITTTGTITLTVPNATSLRSSLSIGNVANLNLNGNGSTYLSGNGTFSVPSGSYSNSNVASYLPTYTGNIGSSGANMNYVWANYVSARFDVTANVMQAPNITSTSILNGVTGNFSGNLNSNNLSVTNLITANIGNITTINSTTINGTTGNFSGNVSGNIIIANTANITGNLNAGNVNGGNLVTANFISGNGYLLTGITANYANFAGQVTNSSQPNITSVGTLTSLTVSGNINGANITGNHYGNGAALSSITGANVTGTVANATYATSAGTAGTVTTAAQPNITSVGTLTSLNVSGNITAGNASLGNNASANYFTGNGFYLTGITVPNTANANFANYAGNVTISSQPNITSLGTLTGLTVNGTSNLGNVGNVKITGGTNGYILQTDGSGNLSWVVGGGSGNGVVGGSNTQVQFNDAGNFGGNSGLTFDKSTGITTINYGNIRGLIKNKGYTGNTTISANLILNFDVLSGPILLNTGIDIVSNSNTTANYNIALNFRGNSTTTLDSILNIGDNINLKFIQVVTMRNPGSGIRTANITLNVGNVYPLLNQIDGVDVPNPTNIVGGGPLTQIGNICIIADGTSSWNNIEISSSSNVTVYGYIQQNLSITKVAANSYITTIKM